MWHRGSVGAVGIPVGFVVLSVTLTTHGNLSDVLGEGLSEGATTLCTDTEIHLGRLLVRGLIPIDWNHGDAAGLNAGNERIELGPCVIASWYGITLYWQRFIHHANEPDECERFTNGAWQSVH
jgi:hypothetical protein